MIGLSTALIDALHAAKLQATLDFLHAGVGAPGIELYASARPASADTAAGATPLVTVPLSRPVGAVSGGELVLDVSADAMVAVTGDPLWGRVSSGAGVVAFDADVSLIDGGGDIEIPQARIYAGGLVRLVLSAIS